MQIDQEIMENITRYYQLKNRGRSHFMSPFATRFLMLYANPVTKLNINVKFCC